MFFSSQISNFLHSTADSTSLRFTIRLCLQEQTDIGVFVFLQSASAASIFHENNRGYCSQILLMLECESQKSSTAKTARTEGPEGNHDPSAFMSKPRKVSGSCVGAAF
jgi:hypothetical protein